MTLEQEIYIFAEKRNLEAGITSAEPFWEQEKILLQKNKNLCTLSFDESVFFRYNRNRLWTGKNIQFFITETCSIAVSQKTAGGLT